MLLIAIHLLLVLQREERWAGRKKTKSKGGNSQSSNAIDLGFGREGSKTQSGSLIDRGFLNVTYGARRGRTMVMQRR